MKHVIEFLKARFALLALTLFVGLMASACGTTEPNNRSARPWNAPKTWEHGLPVGLTEGR
ncbi:MAG: hypothetical protein AB1705_12730 [Verrucomicrobiota bacterium]